MTIAQTIKASTIAPPRMSAALYQGSVSRLAMWKRDCFLFILLASSHEGHQRADLTLVRLAGIDHAGDLTAAENDDAVA